MGQRWGVHKLFSSSAVLGLLAGMCQLPFVFCALNLKSDVQTSVGSAVGLLSVAAMVFNSAAGMYSVLLLDTLMTTTASAWITEWRSTIFAVLNGFNNVGATMGGLLA